MTEESSTNADGGAMTPASKLEALRSKMKELNLDVYLVPSNDPHMSEIAPEAYARRKFLTGLTGSAGTAVITQDEALVWTDSRYWNQFTLEVDRNCWNLMKVGQTSVPKISKWLAELAVKHYKEKKEQLIVGIDPFVHPASFAEEVNKAFIDEQKNELNIDSTTTSSTNNDGDDDESIIGKLDTSNSNLIDPIWGTDRPDVPYSPYRIHPIEYAGISIEFKIKKIRKQMKEKKATLAVFASLDDVAYLFNIRTTGDVECSPVGIAYATISCSLEDSTKKDGGDDDKEPTTTTTTTTKEEVCLYCDSRKVESKEIQEHLKDITIKPYDDIVKDIKEHCSNNNDSNNNNNNKVWMDTSNASYALRNAISNKKVLIDSQNAITPMKAIKNKAEMDGMRKAHIMDGIAFCYFMVDLTKKIVTDDKKVSEVEVDEILTGYRSKQQGFIEPSFPTIAGVGSNGAIIHYRAKEEEKDLLKYLDISTPILIDSGGQYIFGTTDVTRCYYFGKIDTLPEKDEFMNAYTCVLKGHIGVDTMIFPENTPGFVLDVFARKALWESGLDYGHGTGHGVGAALNVHEGPHSISPRFHNHEGLKHAMVVSNEPGYYEDDHFGIRIENLIELTYVKQEHIDEFNKKELKEQSGEDDDDDEETTKTEEEQTKEGGEEAEEEKKQDDEKEKKKSEKKKFLRFDRLTMIPIQTNLIQLDLLTKAEIDWLNTYHEEVFTKISPHLEENSPQLDWLKKACEKV